MSRSKSRRRDIVAKPALPKAPPHVTDLRGLGLIADDEEAGLDIVQSRHGRLYRRVATPASEWTHEAEWGENGEPRFTMRWADPTLYTPEEAEQIGAEFRLVFDELSANEDVLTPELVASVRLDLIHERALERHSRRGVALASAAIAHHLPAVLDKYGLSAATADLTPKQRTAAEVEAAATLAEQVAEQARHMDADEKSREAGLQTLAAGAINNAAASAAVQWQTGWTPSSTDPEAYAAFREVWNQHGEALIVEHIEHEIRLRAGQLGGRATSWALDDRERVAQAWENALASVRGLEATAPTSALAPAPADIPPAQLVAPRPVQGHFRLPMNHLVSAVDEATRNALSRVGWTDFGGTTAPHYVKTTGRGRNVVRISSRPGDGELYVPDEVRAQLWAGLERLGDEAADTFYAVLIALTARGEDSIGEPAWLRPDELLDIRGVKRRRARGEPSNWQHGHRAADLLDTHRALTALAGLWVTLDVVAAPARGKRPAKTLSWEGKVIALTDTMGQRTLAGEIIPHRVRIVLGGWAEHYQQAALRQVGLIAQKAFQYDTSRYKAEKRLTGYLALQFKFNASGRAKPLSCKVETLLEHADITRDAARPGETRKRLETALGRLERDGVSAGWAYAGGAPDLAARGWLDDWLALSVRIIPPPPVDAEYAGLRPEPEAPKLAS